MTTNRPMLKDVDMTTATAPYSSVELDIVQNHGCCRKLAYRVSDRNHVTDLILAYCRQFINSSRSVVQQTLLSHAGLYNMPFTMVVKSSTNSKVLVVRHHSRVTKNQRFDTHRTLSTYLKAKDAEVCRVVQR